MKRILLVANVTKEHVLKFHVPTIKALAEDGWQVDVACGGKEGIPYCHHKYELPIDRSPFKTHFVKAIRQLRSIIKNEEYDIIYCHTSVGGIVGRISAIPARKRGVRVIKFAHGSYFYKGAPLTNWIYFPIYKFLSWVTDAIITITQEDCSFSKKHFSHASIYYIPGIGVDPTRFKFSNPEQIRQNYRKELSIPSDAVVLIYTAELIENKNQGMLIEALNQVLNKNSNVFLLLVGPDHANGQYEALAKKLCITSNVRFLGWRKDVAELYAASDICVASSIREGLGLNIIEAMICGLPVIATNNSGHRAIIENEKNGILVQNGNASEMAYQIINLINSPETRAELVKNSQTGIEQYYNQNVLKRIKAILQEQLIKGNNRNGISD